MKLKSKTENNNIDTTPKTLNDYKKRKENLMDNITHIMLITYSFDSDYIAVPCTSKQEAINQLHKYLNKEVETVIHESEYEPIVREHLDTLVELIYTEDEGYVDSNTDITTYRIIEIGNGYNPNAKFTYTKKS